jgi:acetoacetyl-CoA synthetase
LPEVSDSLVIDTGTLGSEGRLVLYLVLAAGASLDEALRVKIRSLLRSELSPRHVPDEIHQVPGVPRTLSGKKLEVPVRKIVTGTPVGEAADPDSLANPEVLAYFVPDGSERPHGDSSDARAPEDTGAGA